MKEKVFQRYQDYQGYMEQFGIEEEEELRQEKRDIENRRFVVMIVGEAKSGKSSFIDAYLKTDVLPIDVKQCTNALIHIQHSERIFLEVRRENQICHLEGEKEIRDFLNREANFSKSGKQGELELFLFYPLEKDFQEITWIDSPGVNAEGGLGRISEEYLPSVNAIIFVKSLYGQALESTSFIDFFRGKTKRRHKESRFLLLTGSSLFSRQDRESLEKDAEEKYGDYISSEKIIALDSKLKLFWNACRELSEEEIEQKIREEEFDSATVLWYQAKGKKDVFMRSLLEKSNFPYLEETLKLFAKDYEKILCLQFLENIQEAYQKQILIFEDQRQTLMEHRKDPVALQASLDAKRKEIQDLSQKIETGVQKLYEKFVQDDFLEAILEKSYQTWREELSSFQGKRNWEALELWFQEKMKESSKLSLEISEKMIEECQEKLFNDGRKIYLEIFKPNRMDYEVIKADKVRGDFFQISEMLSSLKGHLKANMKRNLENCLYKFTGKMHANCNRLEYACEELMNQQWNSENLRIKMEEISEKISILEKQKEEILWELKL